MDAETRQAIRSLSDLITGFGARLDSIEATARTSQLQNASITNGAITIYDTDGETPLQYIGAQGDGTAGVVNVNGPTPPAPTAPAVEPSALGLSIAWDGTFADDIPQPADFDHAAIHLSTTSGFTHDASTLRGTLSRAGSLSLTPLTVEPHYVVLVAVSTSGAESEPSAQAVATPEPAVAPGSITETEIADDSISTPKLQALAVIADKIAANAVTAGKIDAGAVTAEKLEAVLEIASRIIAGVENGARVELNSSGLHAFNADSTETLTVDGSDGSVSMIGELASGPNGSDRVRINPEGADYPEIRFEPADDPENYSRIWSHPSDAMGQATLRLDSGFSTDGGSLTSYLQTSEYIHAGVFSATEDGNPVLGGHMFLNGTSLQIGVYDSAGTLKAGFTVTDAGINDAQFPNWYSLTGSSGWVTRSGIVSSVKKLSEGYVMIQGEMVPGSSPAAFKNGFVFATLPYTALAPIQNITLPVTLGNNVPYGPPPCIVIQPSGSVAAWYCGVGNSTTAPTVIQFCCIYPLT